MISVIIYHSVEGNAGVISVPKETHREVVEYADQKSLDKYIITKSDRYGFKFKKKKFMGFQYVSRDGGVKVEPYVPPKIKKI